MKVKDGEITGRVIEARFAITGKLVGVPKKNGDHIKRGDLLGVLDSKILQTELDKELADYEKVRADFDSFTKKYPDPQDDNKYIKTQKQAVLNSSVKAVELAKAKLDQINLFSPVDGIILDDNGIVSGLYITPASGSVKIIDTGSYFFEFEIIQKEVFNFMESKKCKIKIDGMKGEIESETSPVFSDGKKFIVKASIPSPKNMLLGMKGKIMTYN